MPEPVHEQRADATGISIARKPNLSIWIGPIMVLAGTISYFAFFARFPLLRDFPWVNLPLVIIGLLISLHGLRRAFASPKRGLLSRIFGSGLFLVGMAFGLLFLTYIFVLSYQLPESDGVVEEAQSAPDFVLSDQDGQTVSFAGVLGNKVVLCFYRGHW